jgi:hypothetical protein
MDHSAVITNNPDGFAHPFHVQCSCGTAGDFDTEQQASDWMNFRHFPYIGPTETFTLTPNVPSDLPHPPTPDSAPSTSEPESGVASETVGDA